jgi:hypothetical protein
MAVSDPNKVASDIFHKLKPSGSTLATIRETFEWLPVGKAVQKLVSRKRHSFLVLFG